MSLVKCFFALFPQFKKVRSWVRTRVGRGPPVSAHPRWRLSSRMRPCRTPTSGCSSFMAARPITGTDAPMRLSDSRLLASTWFGSGRWMRMGSPTTGTGIRVSVGMAFLLFLLGDGQRGEGLGISSPLPGCHHVPATVQPKFQQSFLFMFWRCPRLSSRSECQTFQLYAELATWWCCSFALCLVRQWIHVLRLLWGAFGLFFYVFVVLGS